MIFTVELASIVKRYRLQKNGGWRNLENDNSLTEADFQTSDPAEVTSRTPYASEIEIEDTVYKVSPSTGDISEVLSGGSLVFRKTFPNIPDKQQLRSAVAAGDDEQANVLILNSNGNFELRQRPAFDKNRNDPTVIIQYETFAPQNNYIGREAAADNNHIDGLYCTFLEGWLIHLETGRTQMYYDYICSKSPEEKLKEIESLKTRWIPQY